MSLSTRNSLAAVALLAFLPMFGAGQARAGFVGGSVSGVESAAKASWESQLNELLRGEEGGMGRPSDVPGPTPEAPSPAPKPKQEEAPSATGGAGSPAPSKGGSGSGTGQTLGPVERLALAKPTDSGRLFLAEMSFDPPPSGSRLFRPPRVV